MADVQILVAQTGNTITYHVEIGAAKPYGKPIAVDGKYVGYLKGSTVFQQERAAGYRQILGQFAKDQGYKFVGK